MLLSKLTVLAAEIEATAYTAETLVAADSNFNVYDPDLVANFEYRQRQSGNVFSNRQGTVGPRAGTVTFRTDITGDGAGGVPGWADEFLPACGFVKSAQVFSPSSEGPGSNVKTLTIGVYEDGRKKLLRGCMGTFKIILEAGQDAMIEWTFQGAWAAPVDEAILAPTYPSELPLRFASSAFTLGGVSQAVQRVEIDAGNTVIMREDPSASDATGFKGALVTDRNVNGTLDPEAALIATNDTFGKWLASTEEAMSIPLSDGTDTLTIALPKAQRTNIANGDRNGMRTDPITFEGNRDSSGDDELTLTFS